MKAIQEASEDKILVDSNEDEDKIAMTIRSFNKLLRRKNLSRQRNNKKNDRKKAKDVICYECKQLGYIGSEYPKLKLKMKGVKNKIKAFKTT